ncbi:hypothetical protein BWQ96_00253 [Gracilariopsis chorda]|uniref:Uncharacterized protein n=1 Tax=Gracilariopsis chorda TaxID=448386 RepID=A0A2V3J727_9FLOR|nr:hypothetical protein BWQ96_00253 [Gracilariopsis chorda]|eukprot:PXF50093.1 hypothetical protein BWQ96_00253 [Gracilariopsis chorda]
MVIAGTSYKSTFRYQSSTDVNDLSRSLFSPHEDPLAEEDRWSALSDTQREAWTASNEVIRFSEGMRDVLRATSTLRQSPMLMHVNVQIIAPEHFISVEDENRIIHYASAMTAGSNGTKIMFNVSLAPKHLFKRVAMHSPSDDPTHFMGLLQQTAATLGSTHVMYVIVNHGDDPINHYEARTPFLGTGRTCWVLYTIERKKSLNVADLLTSVERIAQRVYAPKPLYFPVPFIKELTVQVSAYTPGVEHRAHWLDHFDWDGFEDAIKNVAVPSEHLRFSSSQVNSECPMCAKAFRESDKPSRDFVQRAALTLNEMVPFNNTWANGVFSTALRRRVPPNTFRLYVLDLHKTRQSEPVQRLENKPLSFFPGMGIVIFRSTDEDAVAALNTLFVQAFAAAVYGISEPNLYHTLKRGKKSSKQGRPSTVMTDVVSRYLVRSIVETRIAELEEIMEGIIYFDIDPAKSLGDLQYAYFAQRVNLMLFKLQHAQMLLSDSHDAATAIYLAASTSHDIRAIRLAFDLSEEKATFERFRDPTLRCHFSRLKREALRASYFLESTYSRFREMIMCTLTFLGFTALSNFLLRKHTAWKRRGKRE